MISSSITLSLTGFGLKFTPISRGIAYRLSISNKTIYEIIVQKYNEYKIQYERDQQTIKSFANLYRNSLPDNVTD